MTDSQHIEAAIAALEAQRSVLGDAVVDAAAAALREKLAQLRQGDTAGETGDPGTAQQLRQVSVLFMDVVGSTQLSRQLDPEDMHGVLDGTLAAATRIVQAHHGKVLQYAGDSLLAVFGAEHAAEDDAERAVHAGLALLDEGRARAALVEQQHGRSGFGVRVGVHTGNVLLGGGVSDTGNIRGAAVHIAARMEQTAPPLALRISHDTWRQVRGAFEVEVQPPLAIKGVDEPVTSYLVNRARPRAFRPPARGIEGLETRIVGRDAELRRMQQAFESLCRGGGFSAVTLGGEAGQGKSRLLHEFENWVDAQPAHCAVWRARAQPRSQTQAYGLLRDMLAWRFELADGDDPAAARRKLEEGVAALFEADFGTPIAIGNAHVLGHLIGLDFRGSRHVAGIADDGAQIRARGFHIAAQMLRRVARSAPVLLLLDDLHWADDGSLDFLHELAQVNRDVSMMIVGAARPQLYERRPNWAADPARHQRITLEALDARRSGELADVLLQRLPSVPAQLHELLTRGAEGNPFYMEEIVKMLIDQGAIGTDGAAWSVQPERLHAARVPPTLTGVLQARLDSLTPADRKALQQASIVGPAFWHEALGAIDADAPAALPVLQRREMVVPHAHSVLQALREYGFKHHLLHQVTYDTVLKRDRRDGHARVAAWLVALGGADAQRAHPLLPLIAEHFEKAGDPHQACEYYTRAAEHAANRYAQQVVLDVSAKALALVDPQDHATRWRLIALREREYEVLGQRGAQADAQATLLALADALADDARRADVAWRRSRLAFRTGDHATTRAQAQLALELAQRAGDAPLTLWAQQMLSIALYSLGELEPAKAIALEGLSAARALAHPQLESRFINALAVITSRQDDLATAHAYDKALLQLARDIGNPRDEAAALANLGLGLVAFGAFAAAAEHLNEGLRLARAVGARYVEPHILRHLAALAVQRGELESASSHAREALALALEIEDKLAAAVATLTLADAEFARAQLDAAEVDYQRAQALCLELDHPIALDAQAGLARCALAHGDVAAASGWVEPLLAHFAEHRHFEGCDSPQLIHLSCWRVLRESADTRAVGVLDDAHGELQAQAQRINDAALRECFLTQIPVNRDIVRAWHDAHGAAPRS